jgi:hypothetical protein
MSNKEKYHPNSIGSRIAELMLEKLTNNNDNDKQPNQTKDGTSNDQKSLQGQRKKK